MAQNNLSWDEPPVPPEWNGKPRIFAQNVIEGVNTLFTRMRRMMKDQENSKDLPIASPTQLGGIKVGTGVSIDAEGVMSVPIDTELIADSPNPVRNAAVKQALDNLPVPDTSLPVLWENASGVEFGANTPITLSQRASNYKYLVLEFTGAAASMQMIPVGATAVCWTFPSNENTNRIYIFVYKLVWSASLDELSAVYGLRIYHSSATAGGTSTMKPMLKAIYGVK